MKSRSEAIRPAGRSGHSLPIARQNGEDTVRLERELGAERPGINNLIIFPIWIKKPIDYRSPLCFNCSHIIRIDFGAVMIDANLARLRAHRQNLDRYRRLLTGNLSDFERGYVERRIAEEEASLTYLASTAFADRPASRNGLSA